MLGRSLAAGEEGRGAAPVAILSYPFWRSRLGADPGVVGKTILLDGLPHTVIGVMPQGFDYPRGTQLWRPLRMDESSQRPRSVMRPVMLVSIVARARPGVQPADVATEMVRLTGTVRAEYPKEFESAGFLTGMKILATPLQRRLTGDLRPALLVLTGAVGLVLLIACANLANLLLARAASRQREIAVRMALGAARTRVVRQVLTESLILALPGGLAGIVIAFLAVDALNRWKPLVLVNYPAIAIDLRTLAFTFILTLVTGLVFGMAPALGSARVRIQESLKAAGLAQSGSRGATRLRQLLVVVELAVSLVLLIGAGLLARSFVKLARTDLGFAADTLLTMRVNLTGARYTTSASQTAYFNEVMERVKQLPTVRLAAVSTDMPLGSDRPYGGVAFQVTGRPPLPMAQRPASDLTLVTRDFFATLGIPLREGRLFGSQDSTQSPEVIVVNESFARKIFPGENPLGRRILSNREGSAPSTIIGVVGNIRGSELGAEPPPLVYQCICQSTSRYLSRMGLFFRTTGDPRAAIRPIEEQIYSVDRSQPVSDERSMEERLAVSLAPQRFNLILIGTFAAVALVLAALGVYGVMSYLVNRRTREVGIRLALGAQPEQVLRQVVGESLSLAMVAALAGLAGAFALTRYLQTMLYGITAVDTATFAAMPILLASIALAASFIPARRAARIDPVTALREE
jgi:putative ABC transport system permease protein